MGPYNEGDSDVWADRCGGALQRGMDCEGPHPTSNTEIQKTTGAGTVHKLDLFLTVAEKIIVILPTAGSRWYILRIGLS